MKTIIISGPPGAGKTSLIKNAAKHLGEKTAAAKLDALSASEEFILRDAGIDCQTRLSLSFCPDHVSFISFGEFYTRARSRGVKTLLIETAGLCGRCTPYLAGLPAVCVLPCTSNLHIVARMGPVAADADLLVFTRGDMVSNAERQVFSAVASEVNPAAGKMFFNGMTGEGAHAFAGWINTKPDRGLFLQEHLRSRAPRGYCSYCQGGIGVG